MKKQMTLRSLLVITSLLLGLSLQAQVVTIHVETPGTLSSYIPSNEKDLITNLTLTGDLNGTDIGFIREMAGRNVNGGVTSGKLSVLDISGANIVKGGDCFYSSFFSSDNTIGDYMFRETQLISIFIPNSVTSIGSGAFWGCSGLNSVIIGNSVTSIGGGAFLYCRGLSSVIIPNSVTLIGNNAFQDCWGLTSVTIGNSVTLIGYNAFYRCYGLSEILLSKENISFSSVDGVLFSKDESTLILYPNSKSKNYTIPNSVTLISSMAFWGCTRLTSVTIPNSVTSIRSSAFMDCNYRLTNNC